MIRFIAYSDYLCPWCWNASRRLWNLEDEFEGRISIEWRSYLLRPVRRENRDPEKFRRYTESWKRPAEEPDAGDFRAWASDAPPPTHSIPAHCAAKAAARVSRDAFRAMHERLMLAYFHENRDISSPAELAAIWLELGLPPEAAGFMEGEEARASVLRDHEEACSLDATGVPGLRRADNDIIIVGAQPREVYRRWFEKSLSDAIETP
jgi:predicted DsbA family dithiol-disulfide isomerase